MDLEMALHVQRGVTAIIGSGGKTTLLRTLAGELPGSIALTTSTHIFPFDGMPVLDGSKLDEVRGTLAGNRVACVGSPAADGKLAAPCCSFEELGRCADYVLVEADGSRSLPLKAHEPWEPVVPPVSTQTILVVGARGLNRSICSAAHRVERFCELAACHPDDLATPARVARVINAEALATRVLISQISPENRPAAQELVNLLNAPALLWE